MLSYLIGGLMMLVFAVALVKAIEATPDYYAVRPRHPRVTKRIARER